MLTLNKEKLVKIKHLKSGEKLPFYNGQNIAIRRQEPKTLNARLHLMNRERNEYNILHRNFHVPIVAVAVISAQHTCVIGQRLPSLYNSDYWIETNNCTRAYLQADGNFIDQEQAAVIQSDILYCLNKAVSNGFRRQSYPEGLKFHNYNVEAMNVYNEEIFSRIKVMTA